MAYTIQNFRTKKALKDAVAAGVPVFLQRGAFDDPNARRAVVEGPHYPEPHRFYAEVEIENGRVTKVK